MSRPIVLTSPMDGSPQVVCFDTTTLWHLDAAEWAPSTASKAENLDLSIRCPLCPRKRTPIFGFYERTSQNAGPRGGRACEGDRGRCHGVILCPSGTTWGHHETSPPQILASCSMAQVKPGQVVHGHSRCWKPRASSRLLTPEGNRCAIWIGGLSRRRPGNAGRCGRADRCDVQQHGDCIAASTFGQCESVCRHRQTSCGGGAGYSVGGRGGAVRTLFLVMGGAICP